MARFQGKRVSRPWRVILRAADKEIDFRLNSGRRTMAEQRDLVRRLGLYNAATNPHGAAYPNPAAPHIKQGHVNHAVDVDSWNNGENRLQAWAGRHGLALVNNVSTEPWHLDPVNESQFKLVAGRLKPRPKLSQAAQDALYVARARKAGARYAVRILREARREKVRLSLAFALVEQESGFSNVFGHDPTIFAGAGKVTKAKYVAYKAKRGTTRMQGVGPCQLTWWATQDAADREGGCWRVTPNLRIGFRTLAQNIKVAGEHAGIARYNGSGQAAERYAAQVEQRQQKWRRILTGGH